MYRRRGSFDLNFTLQDIEEMIPYELDIHLILINQKIEEYNIEQQQK